MTSFPKIIQIEPTNSCNYSCSMCLNSMWKDNERTFFSVKNFENLAKEVFTEINRLVLYGMGEPLMHPQFLKLLEIARAHMSEEAKIFITTNGSLLDQKTIDVIMDKNLVDEIGFSCETLFHSQETRIGHSLNEKNVVDNIKYLLEHPLRHQFRVGIETVVFKSNAKQLIQLVQNSGELGVDFISVSHLFPYTDELKDEILYTMITKEALPILEEVGEDGWDIILGYTQEQFGEKMQIEYKNQYKIKENIKPKDRPYTIKYKELLKRAKEKNVLLNIPLYMNEKSRIASLHNLEEIFKGCKKVAKEYNMDLYLPEIIPTFSERSCPYVSTDTAIIRSDGEVMPCFKYLWYHSYHLSLHKRESSSFSFGNINEKPFMEIWNDKRYQRFRRKMVDMNKNIPFCGNCSFSSSNCFYVIEDTSDCWGNELFCAECPYSLNLTRCLL